MDGRGQNKKSWKRTLDQGPIIHLAHNALVYIVDVVTIGLCLTTPYSYTTWTKPFNNSSIHCAPLCSSIIPQLVRASRPYNVSLHATFVDSNFKFNFGYKYTCIAIGDPENQYDDQAADRLLRCQDSIEPNPLLGTPSKNQTFIKYSRVTNPKVTHCTQHVLMLSHECAMQPQHLHGSPLCEIASRTAFSTHQRVIRSKHAPSVIATLCVLAPIHNITSIHRCYYRLWIGLKLPFPASASESKASLACPWGHFTWVDMPGAICVPLNPL